MKYPVVLFFRHDQYKYIDPIIENNREKLECTLQITQNTNDLNRLYDNTAHILVTYGETAEEYISTVEPHLVPRLNAKWIHVNAMDVGQFNYQINYCYIHNVIQPRIKTRPAFSMFTSTFNSYHKIVRAYRSLVLQTNRDWEWVIMDDSPDDDHFVFLRKQFANDHRVRLYRRSQNSGSIGEVKNEAIGLCRGTYVVEFDHDDELMPHCLADAQHAFETTPNAGFVYMDCCNIYENGNNFRFGDFIAYGYGGYYSTEITVPSTQNKQWVYVYVTPNINNISAFALIALPNHPRIWKRDVLNRLGSYSEQLPVCDDLEILQRTFADSTIAVVKVHTMGYIQYMNDNNNNFSIIRNREINRLGPQFIAPMFYENQQMHKQFMERGAYEDEGNLHHHTQLWKRPPAPHYIHRYINTIYNGQYTQQICVLGLRAWEIYANEIETHCHTNPKTLLIILEANVETPTLWDAIQNQNQKLKIRNQNLKTLTPHVHIWCYGLPNTNYAELRLYFERLLLFPDAEHPAIVYETTFVADEDAYEDASTNQAPAIPLPEYNTRYGQRWEIINAYTQTEHNYLEIGVEYGNTFCNVLCENKTGVDPSHKVTSNKPEYYQIQNMTSDVYFNQCATFAKIIEQSLSHHHFRPAHAFRRFDVVFIDGMHHAENVVRDLNNSLEYANPMVTVYLDDVLPLNREEQEKIPKRHKIEDGILKYVTPWTGDVWKVAFYLLQHHSSQFQFSVFHHPNYRGVLRMYQIDASLRIPDHAFDTINGYDYTRDFQTYLDLLFPVHRPPPVQNVSV